MQVVSRLASWQGRGRMLAAVLALAAGWLLPIVTGAGAQDRCRIGKPSYCAKYGGDRCQEANSLGPRSCQSWRAECFRCHEPIQDCLGPQQIASDHPRCQACEVQWVSCMRAIDAQYWPNRLSD